MARRAFRDQFPGRAEMIHIAEDKGIPVQATAKKPYSMDRNLLHISFEAGILEDPGSTPPRRNTRPCTYSAFRPKTPRTSPNTSTAGFRTSGDCVAVNGKQADSRSA